MSPESPRLRIALVCLAALLCAPLPRAAQAAPPVPAPVAAAAGEVASATLPLAEVLRLQREVDAAAAGAQRAPAPPAAAALQRAVLSGTLLADAVEVEVALDVAVLANGTWTRVKLLEVGAGTHLTRLPDVEGATLALSEGALQLWTQRAGRYRVELALLERAEREGAQRRARFALGDAAQSELRLRFDPALFRLLGEPARVDAGGALFFPSRSALELRWELAAPQGPARPAPAPLAAPAPEPVIERAQASSVATLEGRRITRVRYELRYGGRQSLSFGIPAGDALQHVYRDGASQSFEVREGAVAIPLDPPPPGEEGAVLELVLGSEPRGFLLSGALQIALPRASWPTHELFLRAHLPDVFEYVWAGGSLSPLAELPAAEFAQRMPTPGVALGFHQVLVGQSAPDVSLRYAVDLRGRYFER